MTYVLSACVFLFVSFFLFLFCSSHVFWVSGYISETYVTNDIFLIWFLLYIYTILPLHLWRSSLFLCCIYSKKNKKKYIKLHNLFINLQKRIDAVIFHWWSYVSECRHARWQFSILFFFLSLSLLYSCHFIFLENKKVNNKTNCSKIVSERQ